MYNKAGGEDEQAGQQTKRGNAGFYGHYAADNLYPLRAGIRSGVYVRTEV